MKIKEERLKLGLTQHQFADMLRIPFRTIQNWEEGKSKCPEYVEQLIIEKLQTKYCPHCGAKIE